MAYKTFTHQIWWVMACYDLTHQIRCAKHTFRGRCDITPMVCCSFGGHSTPQFLQCACNKHVSIFPVGKAFVKQMLAIIRMHYTFYVLCNRVI